LIIYLSLRKMDKLIGGEGTARVAQAEKLALTSYLTGTVMSVLIGLLNPHGIIIVITSAAAATLGGTSGLAWMDAVAKSKEGASRATAAPGTKLGLDSCRVGRRNSIRSNIGTQPVSLDAPENSNQGPHLGCQSQ